MTTNENLDDVLLFLKKNYYNHHGDFHELQSLIPHKTYMETGLLLLLEQLHTDGMVDKKIGDSYPNEYGMWKITLRGIKFLNDGGYVKQDIRNTKKEYRNKIIYIASIIAAVASVAALVVAMIK